MANPTRQPTDEKAGGNAAEEPPALLTSGVNELFSDPNQVRIILREMQVLQQNTRGELPMSTTPAISTQASSRDTSRYSENENMDTSHLVARGQRTVSMENVDQSFVRNVDAAIQGTVSQSYSDTEQTGSFGHTDDQQGRAAPMQTIDQHQLQNLIGCSASLETFDESQLFGTGEPTVTEPTISVTCPPFQRFRYESERMPRKRGPKCRTDPDDDKNTLAEILISDYKGRLSITAYCVDVYGKLHPFLLHGDRCKDGVYYDEWDITNINSLLKLAKVGVTTPKTKEYTGFLQQKKQQLTNLQADGATRDAIMDIKDKDVVYLLVEAVLDPESGAKRIIVGPKIIRNRKRGTEFKVDTVQPVSTPATGGNRGNQNKDCVLVVVTEGTAFPNSNNVGVQLRERRNGHIVWESRLLRGKDLRIIKKAVIEFVPPPYANPDIDKPVQVELCLIDIDTDQESEPVPFMYSPVVDEYGVERKAKKRKLETPASMNKEMIETSVQAQRQTIKNLTDKGKHTGTVPSRSGPLQSQLTTTAELINGQRRNQGMSLVTEDPIDQHLSAIPAPKLTSTMQSLQWTPHQSHPYSPISPAGPTVTHPQVVTLSDPNPALVTSAESVFSSRPAMASSLQASTLTLSSALPSTGQWATYDRMYNRQQQMGQQAMAAQTQAQSPQDMVQQEEPVVMITMPAQQQQQQQQVMMTVPGQQQQLVTTVQGHQQQPVMTTMEEQQQQLMTTMPGQLKQQVMTTVQEQQQQQQLMTTMAGQQASQPREQAEMQTLAQLETAIKQFKHQLQPNQAFGIVNGQVCIVNDDVSHTASVNPGSTYAPTTSIQNVGDQMVIVKSMQQQHPSSDTPQQGQTCAPAGTRLRSGLQSNPAQLQNTPAAPPQVDYAALLQQLQTNYPPNIQVNIQQQGMASQYASGVSEHQQPPPSYSLVGLTDRSYDTQAATGAYVDDPTNDLDDCDVEIDSGVSNQTSTDTNDPNEGVQVMDSDQYVDNSDDKIEDDYFVNDVASNIVVGEYMAETEVSYPDNEIID